MRRRPLAWVALCLVIIAAVRLKTGSCDRPGEGYVSLEEMTTYESLIVTGQVYLKDEKSVYLKSVNLMISGFDATGHSVAGTQQTIPIQENIKCELEEAGELPMGSVVTIRGTFMPFYHATNPGEFDAAEYYKTLKLGGRLLKAEVLASGRDFWRLREGLYQLKLYFRQRLYSIFQEKEAAVMCALLLGDKSELDSELKDLYQRNGILHILSISSLHITIIGMSIYKLFRRAGLPIWMAACAGSVLLLLYGGMTGFSVSAARAIGMYLLRMLAEICGRTYDMPIALALLAALMVTGNPHYLRHSGFLLSFTSVLGISVVYQSFLPRKTASAGKVSLWKKIGRKLAESALASLSITLATLPVQLWFYYEVPVYSVLLNLLVLPFMKPLMMTGLAVMLIPAAGFLGGADWVILKGYELLCRAFDELPFSVWNPGRPELWQIVTYYCILVGVLAFVRWRRRREETRSDVQSLEARSGNRACHMTVFLSGAALSIAFFCLGLRPSTGDRVTFLDVGQGDCIVVQTASGESYLFDCGSSSRSSVGRYVLIPFLKYSGIHRLDAVILSHPDEDHINGVLELFELAGKNGLELGQLVLPAVESGAREEQMGKIIQAAEGYEGRKALSVGYLAAGEGWRCGSAEFLCVHPAKEWPAEDKNAYSLCVYADFGGKVSLLLTGDVEGAGETALTEELAERNIAGVTILKTSHHGSRYTTSKEFLAQAAPSLSVISCGRNNRYGHPHEELLLRLEEAGSLVLRTDRAGAVIVRIRGARVEAGCYGGP